MSDLDNEWLEFADNEDCEDNDISSCENESKTQIVAPEPSDIYINKN